MVTLYTNDKNQRGNVGMTDGTDAWTCMSSKPHNHFKELQGPRNVRLVEIWWQQKKQKDFKIFAQSGTCIRRWRRRIDNYTTGLLILSDFSHCGKITSKKLCIFYEPRGICSQTLINLISTSLTILIYTEVYKPTWFKVFFQWFLKWRNRQWWKRILVLKCPLFNWLCQLIFHDIITVEKLKKRRTTSATTSIS